MNYKRIDLPFEYDALEPHFDAETIKLHYEAHHKGYETKLNDAINGKGIEKKYPTLIELMKQYQNIEEQETRISIREFGGGLINHNFFFQNLKKDVEFKDSKLKDKIIETWGSIEEFKQAFKKESLILFGSGWVWLVKKKLTGELKIIKTFNQDNPWYLGFNVILGLDLWEHAYYLKYHSNRATYIDAFWNVVDWNKAIENFES